MSNSNSKIRALSDCSSESGDHQPIDQEIAREMQKGMGIGNGGGGLKDPRARLITPLLTDSPSPFLSNGEPTTPFSPFLSSPYHSSLIFNQFPRGSFGSPPSPIMVPSSLNADDAASISSAAFFSQSESSHCCSSSLSSLRFDWTGLVAKAARPFELIETGSVKIPFYVHVLFFIIGASPWYLANALFLQLPLLLELPQKEAIASQITLAIQSANFLIPLYFYIRKVYQLRVQHFMLFLITLTFLISCAFALSWSLAGPESTESRATFFSLMALSFGSGAVGCLSNVTFWEFTAIYHPALITSLAVGNAFSSIIPSALASAQNPGPSARFDFSVYFVVSTILLAIPMVAYIFILRSDRIKELKRERWGDESRRLGRPYHISGSGSEREAWSFVASSTHPKGTSFGSSRFQGDPDWTDVEGEAAEGDQEEGERGGAEPRKEQRRTMRQQPESAQAQETQQPSQLDQGLLMARSPSGTYSERTRLTPGLTNRSTYSSTISEADYFLPEASAKDVSIAWKELLVIFWISFVNYSLPGLTTFLLSGYPDPEQVLVFFIIMGMIGGTLGRVLSGLINYVPHVVLVIIQAMMFVLFFLGDPLSWARWLGWLLVVDSFLFAFIYGLQSTVMFKNAAMHIDTRFAQRLCRWLGAAEQLGALLAAAFVFGLVYGGVFS